MLQDLGSHVFKNEFSLRHGPKDNDFVLIFKEHEVLVRGDGVHEPLSLPHVGNLKDRNLLYLFSIDNRGYYLYRGDTNLVHIEGFSFQSNMVLRSDNPRVACFAGFTAYHLFCFYQNNRFCGRCGSLTTHSKTERALVCTKCSNIIYPKIAPAVIVGIVNQDKILVTRYKDRPYRGLALIAGFCEIGETPEDTARRESMEEVGLKIKDLRYCGSQPWGLDCNVLFGFMAKVDGEPLIRRDDGELAEAFFISRDEITTEDSPISLTKTMIKNFKEGKY